MIRLAVNGARGRMGRRVVALAHDASQYELVREIGRSDDAHAPPDSAPAHRIDLIIDFSCDQGTKKALNAAAHHRAALLVATTALSDDTVDALRKHAARCPVMLAPNTSRSLAVLLHIAGQAARLLHDGCDIDIIEWHHAAKKDRPSGTAKRLAEVVQHATGNPVPDDHMHSIRAGGIIGRHTLQLVAGDEMLELNHTILNRDVFAAGALEAGRWLVRQPPGLYHIEQAWGLQPAHAHAQPDSQ